MQSEIEAFLNHLECEKRYSPHTLTAYRGDLEQARLFLEAHGVEEYGEVDAPILRSWLAGLIEGQGKTPISNRSVARKAASLKSFFKYLLGEGHIGSNPASRLTAPKIPKRLPAFVEEKQMERLLERLDFPDDFEGCRDKTIIELFYATGIRRAELLGLRMEDIRFAQNTISVMGKRKKQRLIPITPSLVRQLDHYLDIRRAYFGETAEKSLFLTRKGKPMYPKLVYNVVKKYLGAVSATEAKGPHTLRHTFATHLSNRGADLNAIKELLGHANLSATQIYVHNSIDRLKRVYEKAHPKGKKDGYDSTEKQPKIP